ncbi:MAG TPA: NADP-dependent phosphogluconate dehydrogenase [Saprospiraceae bacterium]|nr:NADP-dependent phosphogluconate dehydrogenase [Saprospiraceae bacterium]
MKQQFGIAGLGSMGTYVARKLAQKGFALSLYNRHLEGTEEKVASGLINRYPELSQASGYDDLAGFVSSLSSPRIILLMVDAGSATEELINSLVPFLQENDLIMDGGNAHFEDSTRRCRQLHEKGIQYLGCGISGGMRNFDIGLSLMPGGSMAAYEKAKPALHALSAKAVDGSPCCTYIGDEGAGHFVKIVHNGIEYAEMELLAEVYSLLRWAVGLTPGHISDVLATWKQTDANGYLLEITLDILRERQGDAWVIDSILDSAGYKGTGGWAVQAAASFGIPAMMITAALHARYLSGQRHIRNHLNEVTASQSKKDVAVSTTDIFNAFQLARLINYHEGYAIIRAASVHFGWNINLASLSKIWTNGCIIRSALMNRFVQLWESWDDELILHDEIKGIIKSAWPGLRRIIQVATSETIFTPCLVGASQYIAGASLRYPMANLIAAQRDYFGHHGFWTVEDPSGDLHHYPWKHE